MKIIHLSGFTAEERRAHRDIIHSNVLTYIKTLLQAAHKMDNRLGKKNKVCSPPTPQSNQETTQFPRAGSLSSSRFHFRGCFSPCQEPGRSYAHGSTGGSISAVPHCCERMGAKPEFLNSDLLSYFCVSVTDPILDLFRCVGQS